MFPRCTIYPHLQYEAVHELQRFYFELIYTYSFTDIGDTHSYAIKFDYFIRKKVVFFNNKKNYALYTVFICVHFVTRILEDKNRF